MKTSCWRFAYDEARLTDILVSKVLTFPDFHRWPQAKRNRIEKITPDMREFHFVFLANFDSTKQIGTVKGVGRILRIAPEGIEMDWKRPVVSWKLEPNPQGGVMQWRNECVFNFDPPPVKRYKLLERSSKLFDIT